MELVKSYIFLIIFGVLLENGHLIVSVRKWILKNIK